MTETTANPNTKVLRAPNIKIETPRKGDPAWVNIILQWVIQDAMHQTMQVIDRVGSITRKFEDFAQDTITITDPVTGAIITISGAGVGEAISEFVKSWMLQDIPGTSINAAGDVVQGA